MAGTKKEFIIQKGVLKEYRGEGGDVVIPEGVTRIGANVFYQCESLTSVNIPEGVTEIGWFAFLDCKSLTSVTIPESVTHIYDDAFENCTNLTNLYVNSECLSIFTFAEKLKFVCSFLAEPEKYSDKGREIYTVYIKRQKKKILGTIIEQQIIPALAKLLSMKLITVKDIDAFIEKANKENKTEALAMLMDYKNKTFSHEDVAKEETRKINKALNYNPLSVEEMKKIWSYKTNPDKTITITSYRGSETEVTVPSVIGKSTVTALGDHVFSPNQNRAKNREERRAITSITIPAGVIKISECALGQ